MPERHVRVEKPGNAERTIPRSELAAHIAAGWFPVWGQSVETLSNQVAVLQDSLVDLAGEVEGLAGSSPPGDGGDAVGVPGQPGAAGKSAYELAVQQGFSGTLQQWLASLVGATSTVPGPPGSAGKDAYEVARDLGYGGTRTQWLATLVGAQGVKGDKGDPGAASTVPGPPGADSTVPGPPGLGFTAVAKTAADQAFSTVTLANATGLSASLAANTPYRLDLLLSITSAATTTGWQFGFTGPAMTSFLAVCDYQSSATAWTSATLTAIGAFPLVTAAYAAAPTPIAVRVSALVLPSAGGTLQVQCRSEVASSAITVKRGSTLQLT